MTFYSWLCYKEFRALMKDIKNVFVKPVRKYYFGKIMYGTPYFYPRGFVGSLIHISKNKFNTFRSKTIKVRSYYVTVGTPIRIIFVGLGWKDKYDSPRVEWLPTFSVYFFKWQFCIFWCSPTDDLWDYDIYWEMVLWYREYASCNIDKAEATWGWIDYDTKESTWKSEFIIKKN
jgi:hypothetical protein